jgi:hypothetical protein
MNQFLWGALSALSVVAAVFFFKFWRRTHDQLLAAFAAGFGILAVHWVALGLLNPANEARAYWFLLRFAAFALITWGVIVKNRSEPVPRGPAPPR